MKFVILTFALCTLSFAATASYTPSQSVDQFCADRVDPNFEKNLVKDYANLMTFSNQGGLLNKGVCWWHSRFQRNALYLTIYKPQEDYPSLEEAAKIVDKIRAGNEIITITGFRNFFEFSKAHSRLIQTELEKWQKSDGIIKFNWVNGFFRGKDSVSASKLKGMMDELYDYVTIKGNIAYQKLQIKGIDSHSWLVINMKKVDGGYDLEILDSNLPFQTSVYPYRKGQTNFYHSYFGDFVPYLERRKELNKVKLAILKKCDQSKYKKLKAQDEIEKEEE